MWNIIGWLVIGGLAGWVASLIMKTDAQMGTVANIVVGIIGAVLGGWITSALTNVDLAGPWSLTSFLIAILGAVILLAILRLFRRA